jgi:hypothetical protein
MELKYEPDIPVSKISKLPLPPEKYILAAVKDLAAGGPLKRPQDVEKRRFSSPGCPDDGYALATAYHQFQIIEQFDRVWPATEYFG